MWLRTILRKKSDISGQNFLTQNGELLLRKQISFSQGRSYSIRTFTLSELQEATDNFDERRRLDSGFCKHYRGILDSQEVVVKNANGNSAVADDEDNNSLVEEHITEIVVLSNLRHRSVVQLLGCCLETPVPLLVYEFVPNGNLLHNMDRWSTVEPPPWTTRLQIAIDVADALSYLHHYTSRPVVHKNLGTETIILHEDNTAKLAGFGHSVPIPPGKTQVEEDGFRGTIGYLDPEYISTYMVTEKVDIYAFGVLLLELMMGGHFFNSFYEHLFKVRAGLEGLGDPLMTQSGPIKTVLPEEATRQHQLALEAACLEKLVADAGALGNAEGKTEQFRAFAKLALRCAWPRMQQRPAMKEVVQDLRRIRSLAPP